MLSFFLFDRSPVLINITGHAEVPIAFTKNSTYIQELKPFISQTDWLDPASLNRQIFEAQNIKDCPLCIPRKYVGNGNSTSRDLILSVLYREKYYNIVTFMRSLRTTKSKATVIIFVTDQWLSNCPKKHIEKAKKCGAIFLNVHDIKIVGRVTEITSRFILFKVFLAHFKNLFDRILICDVFDTFFQSDPFTVNFSANNTRVSCENDNLAFNSPNSEWIRAVDHSFSYGFYQDKKILCLGLLYGGIEPMFETMKKFADHEYLKTFGFGLLDQPVFNYMHYRGLLKNIVPDCDSDNMVSATKWHFSQNPNEEGVMTTEIPVRDKIPTTIHQYDRSCPLRRFIAKYCPKLGEWHNSTYAANLFLFQRCY